MDDSRSQDTIGVALLGFGFAGHTFHAPFITTTPGLDLRVIATSQLAKVREEYRDVAVVSSPLEAIERDDVDLVGVATPNDSHAPMAEAALRAGRHVVVDKPFTVTLAGAQRVVSLAGQVGRQLSVYQNRRYDSDFLGLREALASGVIGDVVEYRSEISRWRPLVRDRWRERPGAGAGLWFDLGPHLVDQSLLLFGMPQAVHGAIRALRPGATVDDWFVVRLTYSTREVILESSMLARDAVPRFVVRGTHGTLVKQGHDHQERRLMAGERPPAADWGRDSDPLLILREDREAEPVTVPDGNYGRFYVEMRDAIRGESAPPVTPAAALDVMAVLTAGARSSLEGRAIDPA